MAFPSPRAVPCRVCRLVVSRTRGPCCGPGAPCAAPSSPAPCSGGARVCSRLRTLIPPFSAAAGLGLQPRAAHRSPQAVPPENCCFCLSLRVTAVTQEGQPRALGSPAQKRESWVATSGSACHSPMERWLLSPQAPFSSSAEWEEQWHLPEAGGDPATVDIPGVDPLCPPHGPSWTACQRCTACPWLEPVTGTPRAGPGLAA